VSEPCGVDQREEADEKREVVGDRLAKRDGASREHRQLAAPGRNADDGGVGHWVFGFGKNVYTSPVTASLATPQPMDDLSSNASSFNELRLFSARFFTH